MIFLRLQDERSELPPTIVGGNASAVAGTASAVGHGIEVAIEFTPVEHPVEPLDYDQPIQCPLPEPSILNVSCKPCRVYGTHVFVDVGGSF